MDEKSIKYVSDLSKEQFDLLYECVKSYLHLVPYVNEVPMKPLVSLESKTQLLLALVICGHGLDLGIIAFISDKCVVTIQRVFSSWVVFVATVFNQIDPKTEKGFLIKKFQNYIGRLDMKKLIWSLMQ